jgi:hypothetical protein
MYFPTKEPAAAQALTPTGPVGDMPSSPPRMLWKGAIALSILACLPALSALPLAYMLHDQTIGIVLAGIGTGLGAVGFLLCLRRNGTSAGLLLATTALCALGLVAVIKFVGNGDDPSDQSRRADIRASDDSSGQSRRAEVNLRGHGVAPQTREERLVAEHILDHADDPDSVEFVEWGPHALAANPADRDLFDEGGIFHFMGIFVRGLVTGSDAIIRIRFRCHQAGAHGKAQYDELWWIGSGKVFANEGLLNRGLIRAHGNPWSGIPGGMPNSGLEKWKEKAIGENRRARENRSPFDGIGEGGAKDAAAKAGQDEGRRKEGRGPK